MFRRAVFVLGLASCARGGVEIIVTPDSSAIDHIALFVGVGSHADTWLIPESRQIYPRVSAWARDPYNDADVRAVADGQPVTFQLVDSPDDLLGVVIAVGFAGEVPQSAAAGRALQVPHDYVARYNLTLTSVINNQKLALDLWHAPPATTDTTCVVLADLGNPPHVDAVLAPTDPDCDGLDKVNVNECAPTFWNGYSRPHLDQVGCLLSEAVTMSVTSCVLGGPSCIDGQGLGTGCTTASVYCLPLQTCEACGGSTPSSFDCARNYSLLPVPRPPHIQCNLKVVGQQICNDTLALPTPLNLGNRTCKTQDPGVQITQGMSGWAAQTTFTRTGIAMQLEVKNLQSTCAFEIVPSGTLGTAGTNTQVSGLVAAELDNGRGVAMPIVFTFVPALACGATADACTLPLVPATDPFFACINADPIPR